jgi:hypothetical protein
MFHFGLGQQLHTIQWHFEVGQPIQIGDIIATLSEDFYNKKTNQHILSMIVLESTQCELHDHVLTCMKKAT